MTATMPVITISPELFSSMGFEEMMSMQPNTIKAPTYQPMTAKDISYIRNKLPAVCNQPCTDIYRTLRKLVPSASELSYLCYVYAWGYLQGSRGVADWHGQTIRRKK